MFRGEVVAPDKSGFRVSYSDGSEGGKADPLQERPLRKKGGRATSWYNALDEESEDQVKVLFIGGTIFEGSMALKRISYLLVI